MLSDRGRKVDPLTPKEMKKAIGKPFKQTKLKLKKGFNNAPIVYQRLMVQALSPTQQRIVYEGILRATNAVEAKKMAYTYQKEGWGYRQLTIDRDRDVGVLQFKGLDVLVFFKRQINAYEPAPDEPVPIGILEDPEDAWVSIDLFSQSPRQMNNVLREEFVTLQRSILELSVLNKHLQQDLNAANIKIEALKHAVTKSLPAIKSKKKRA